jgi:excinuclease UvrABC nuclease subunit
VVNSEEDALLLENNLIKKYQPRYNVLLKDGKTYPSICITNELYPRIFSTRNINKKWGTYFGPYSHISTMYARLDIIKRLYKELNEAIDELELIFSRCCQDELYLDWVCDYGHGFLGEAGYDKYPKRLYEEREAA